MYHYTIYKSIEQEIPDVNLKFFVDDITIYYKKDISNEKIINDLKIIEKIYNYYGMSINKLKTKFVNFSKYCTKQSNSTLYLGVPISNNYNDIITIISKMYGKKLINLLNDTELNWLILHYGNDIIVNFSGQKKTLRYVIKCIEMSISWRLQYFDINNKNFKNKLKKNKFLFKIFSEKNNKIDKINKILTLLSSGNDINILDKYNFMDETSKKLKYLDIPYIK